MFIFIILQFMLNFCKNTAKITPQNPIAKTNNLNQYFSKLQLGFLSQKLGQQMIPPLIMPNMEIKNTKIDFMLIKNK